MQFLNKRSVAIGGVFLVLIAAAIWFQNRGSQSNEYYDAASGETVSDPADKSPEAFGRRGDEPVFLGIGKLLDYGVTSTQLTATKKAFTDYARQGSKITEISINVASIDKEKHDKTAARIWDVLNFSGTFDRSRSYKARLEYFDLTTIRLTLYDSGGKQLFDSGEINPEDND
jgi:hypothetical protein